MYELRASMSFFLFMNIMESFMEFEYIIKCTMQQRILTSLGNRINIFISTMKTYNDHYQEQLYRHSSH